MWAAQDTLISHCGLCCLEAWQTCPLLGAVLSAISCLHVEAHPASAAGLKNLVWLSCRGLMACSLQHVMVCLGDRVLCLVGCMPGHAVNIHTVYHAINVQNTAGISEREPS
jgi:hypothetical protein